MQALSLINQLSAAFVLVFVSMNASAEVIDSAPGGFTTSTEIVIEASTARAWQAATDEVGRWWSSDHTISGDASRLSITARPQGCFCEDLDNDAGVVHLSVTMVSPQRVLRLTGGLGPLGLMGLNGNMTWEFSAVQGDADKTSTKVKFTYAVGGYYPPGLDSVAEPVDAVVADALLRLKTYIETGNPERA